MKRTFLWVFFSVTGLLMAGGPKTADIDKIFEQWDKSDSPGCAVGVIQDGKLVFKRGYGSANLEYGIPIESDSVFRIASTSKQFAAVATALLAEEGKISLDDDIRKHLPEMPEYEADVTIRQLIHHTSGIRDYLTLMGLSGVGNNDWYSDEDVMKMLSRQKDLNFKPGESHLYSNSGYFLLSQIIKRVTGQSLREYAHEKMFKPLGMDNTHFHDDHTRIVPKRATGYYPGASGFQIAVTTLEMCGDGGVFTTVEDLLKWDANFYNNRLGKGGPAFIEQILTPGVLNDGEKLNYAFGLMVNDDRGLKRVQHGGAFVGYRAEMIRYPEKKFSVVVLCNLGTMNPTRLAQQVADLYLAEFFKKDTDNTAQAGKTSKAKPAAKVDAKTLETLVGDYTDPEHQFMSLLVEDGKLYRSIIGRPKVQLLPLSQWEYKYEDRDLRLIFQRTEKGDVTGFRLVSESFGWDRPYERFTIHQATDKDYDAAAGSFYSSELDVTYTLSKSNDGLILEAPGQEPVSLNSYFKDEYQAPFGMQLVMNPDHDGFLLHAGRVRNLEFARK